MEKNYRVNGLSKKGSYQVWAMDITARNQKEAIGKATEYWYKGHSCHLFGVKATRLSDYDEFLYNYWVKVEDYYEDKHKGK